MSINNLFGVGFGKEPTLPTKVFPPITLDPQQQKAVCSSHSNNVVIAGAGSGKTRVITERIKYLLDKGVEPSSIVAITFTNLASDEIRERLQNVKGIGDVFIGTIHSFANKIMKLSGIEYKIYSKEIDLEYHQALIEKYCHFLTFNRYLEYRDLKDKVEIGEAGEYSLVSFLLTSEQAELRAIERKVDVINLGVDGMDCLMYPITITMLCDKNKVIDFDTLLKYANDYFTSLNTRVHHLLVDEFQDVGTLEYNFIKGLNAENNFFVGDDYQSIYGFKGGNVNLLLSLTKNPDYYVHILNNNYRNGAKILDMADKIIRQVSKKFDKEIVPLSDRVGTVGVYSKASIESMLRKTFIENDEEPKFRDWFILVRTNMELVTISKMCADLGIPCTSFRREGMSLSELRTLMRVNSVKLLTVHTSKGLEVDNVMLYGNFPIYCPSYLNKEEERKVMYVGVTRARENLYIFN